MKKIKATDFDKKFDAGDDITPYLDLKKISRPSLKPKRVNVDFPTWMVNSLDRHADHLGVTRQSLIKMWLNERLTDSNPSHTAR